MLPAGFALNAHLRRAVKSRRNLLTGWSVTIVLLVLNVSGFGRYYIAGESDRPIWSASHWLPGLLCAVLCIVHIVGAAFPPPPRSLSGHRQSLHPLQLAQFRLQVLLAEGRVAFCCVALADQDVLSFGRQCQPQILAHQRIERLPRRAVHIELHGG